MIKILFIKKYKNIYFSAVNCLHPKVFVASTLTVIQNVIENL